MFCREMCLHRNTAACYWLDERSSIVGLRTSLNFTITSRQALRYEQPSDEWASQLLCSVHTSV
jgi:hypothetical protein